MNEQTMRSAVTLIDYVRCPRAEANTCPKGSWMVQAGGCECPPPEKLWWAKCSCGWISIPNADRDYVRRVARGHGQCWHAPKTWRTRTVRQEMGL